MKEIMLILCGIIIIAGCRRKESTQFPNVINTNSESGTLLIKVLDKNSQPAGKSYVNVISFVSASTSSYYYNTLVDDSTDGNGEYSAGKLLQGEYTTNVSIKINNITYTDQKSFQIIAGETKTIRLYPTKNIGKVKIQILNYNTDSPYSGLHVALLDDYYYYSNTSFANLLNKVLFTQTTDANGWVTFNDIPAGNSFGLLLYYDSNHYIINNSISAQKGTEREYFLEVSIP